MIVRGQQKTIHITRSKIWWIAIPLFISLVGLLTSCEPETEPARSQLQAPEVLKEGHKQRATRNESPPAVSGSLLPKKIVAFGDSLTAGLGVATQDAYPTQLQQRLAQAGYHLQVVNAGVSGETSAGGVRRVKWVLKSRPDLVIVELGGNDGLRGLDPHQTKANIRNIIEQFQAAKVPVLLTGMKMPPNMGKEYTKEFADIYPSLAKEMNVPLLPFFLQDVALHKTRMQADGIHPTKEGYTIIVEHLMPELIPLLNEIGIHPDKAPSPERNPT